MKPTTRRLRNTLVNAGVSLLSIALAFGAFEIVLSLGFLDRPDDPAPVWIPPGYKEKDRKINDAKIPFYTKNFFPFTDIVHSPEKRNGVRRVAVLGDSFIWGDGLPDGEAWNRKLESKIRAAYPYAEVLHWGIPGWSTDVEYRFLEEVGKNFHIDYLIVGFVTNDLDLGTVERKEFSWHRSSLLFPVRRAFPLAFDFIHKHVNRFLETRVYRDHGYEAWETALYSRDNLASYGRLIGELSAFCRKRGIGLLVVMTPQGTDPAIRRKFDAVIPLLNIAGVEYLDLYPAVLRRFGGANPRTLWANPANAHPGPLMTELFASEVFEHLRARNVLSKPPESASRPADPLAGLTRSAAEPVFALTAVEDRLVGGQEDRTFPVDGRKGHLFLEGYAMEAGGNAGAGGVYVVVDGRERFPTYYGPSYYLARPSLRNDRFEMVPDSGFHFKIHLPLAEIGTGRHTLSFLVLSGDRKRYHRPSRTLEIDVR